MSVDPRKRLTRLELEFEKGKWELATAKQYELLTKEGVWRAFLNSYTGKGFVVFDEEVIEEEEVMKALKDLNAKVLERKELTVGDLIETSYSWNNVIGKD